jgi:hypothetical protein
MPDDRPLVDLNEIAFKLDELSERIEMVKEHVMFFPPGQRDSIMVSHVVAQGDLVRHIIARVTALINSDTAATKPLTGEKACHIT